MGIDKAGPIPKGNADFDLIVEIFEQYFEYFTLGAVHQLDNIG